MTRVTQVFEGFATIIAVIALGAFLAHIRVLDLPAQVLLSRLAFFVASPALLVTVLADTDVTAVFSRNLAASFVGVAVAALLYIASARFVLHREPAETVIGALCAAYVNAGNLGLPIASYVLGDVALVAPVLLMQLLVLQPVALAVLDHTTSTGPVSIGRLLSRPLRTPLTVGSLIGLRPRGDRAGPPARRARPARPRRRDGGAGDAAGLRHLAAPRPTPRARHQRRRADLAGGPQARRPAGGGLPDRPAARPRRRGAARGDRPLRPPTAQNIFVHATRYDRAVVLARDTIFVTTVLSVPAILLITALLA